MDYLVIYAHPNPKSFNHAVKETIERILTEKKRSFAVRDLYALGFDPVLKGADFASFSKGIILPDLAAEQDLIRQAKALLVIHPVWWFGLPSILKGYIDRVFSHGFAYAMDSKGVHGLLDGKRVMIFSTTGGPREAYESGGFKQAIHQTVDAGIFGFCGITAERHHYFYGVPSAPEADRKRMLEELSQIPF